MKKKILKLIFIVAFIIVLLLFIVFGNKFYLINKIYNKLSKNKEITNFKTTVEGYVNDEFKNKYTILTDGINTVLITYYGNEITQKLYLDENNNIAYRINVKDKIYATEDLSNTYNGFKDLLTSELYESELTLKDKLEMALKWKIKSDDKYYYVNEASNDMEFIVDKENCFKVQVINCSDNAYISKFSDTNINCVSKEEVSIPDLSEYKKVELLEYITLTK